MRVPLMTAVMKQPGQGYPFLCSDSGWNYSFMLLL